MKKLLLAVLLVVTQALPAYAHDVTGARPLPNPPSNIPGTTDIYFLAMAQIDSCVDTAESNPRLNNNCGYNGQVGFLAQVRGQGQIKVLGKWVRITQVNKRMVRMGSGLSQQQYDSSFAVLFSTQCPPELNDWWDFRTIAKLGYNWHGDWGWTSWVPSLPTEIYCGD